MNLKLKKPLVFFDIESTGLSTTSDRIVEISFVKLSPNGEIKTLTKRINPGIPISAEAEMVHGISNDDVKDCPKFNEVAKTFAQFIEGCDLGGYNCVKFDLPLLVEEFLRLNIDLKIEGRNVVDAQKIFHLMEPRTLSAAYKFYCNKSLENAHSAEADTLATLEVLDAQVIKYNGVKIEDKATGKEITPVENDMAVLHKLSMSNQIDFSARFVYNKLGQPVFNFGKHKDKMVSFVLKSEPGYYDWFMNSDFPLESKKKFTELKIKEMSK